MSVHGTTQLKAMISATARDLTEQRLAAQDACIAQDVFPVWMKHLPAQDHDGFDVSMQMVDQADIYIGILAWRYGWEPEFKNPRQVSITEMEFDRALERKAKGELKEILVFIMDESEPVLPANFEVSETAQQKLRAFKARVSKDRVVGFFKSKDDLQRQISEALAALKRRLPPPPPDSDAGKPTLADYHPTPFRAKPDYIQRFKFIGRKDQLNILSNWAVDDDSTILLFEAIGGNGKSALTWHWARDESGEFAAKCRPRDNPWAGRFWYSFYERGATMSDFCCCALAYMTGARMAELERRPFATLQEDFLSHLHARPWLLILDGIERVLVHYHQLDPSEDPDEAADKPTDHILNRGPTDAIRDEDNDLLLALSAAAPSKILMSTRLLPRVLLNDTGACIPRVRLLDLPGLNDADAEAFLRSCGDGGNLIKGESGFIRLFLKDNCDNHPLTIGALGGLIVGYRKAPGDFTRWLADPHAGGALDFGKLDLKQRRNHILKAALDNLPVPSRQLLSILALLYGSVDYATIEALSPHRPPKPVSEADQPVPPEMRWHWEWASDDEKADMKKAYPRELAEWEQLPAIKDWRAMCRAAEQDLDATLTALTRHRGLLQYDGRRQIYELHPVVRSVIARSLAGDEKTSAGEQIVDYFTALPHNPYQKARSLADLECGLHVVRTLLKLGRHQQAVEAYAGDFSQALFWNLEAYEESLSLLRPLFPEGWDTLPHAVESGLASFLANDAAIALGKSGQLETALVVLGARLRSDLSSEAWSGLNMALGNIFINLLAQNRLAPALRMNSADLDLAMLREDDERLFGGRLSLFRHQARVGRWTQAAATWATLDAMGRHWQRNAYLPGAAEVQLAQFLFWQDRLEEADLTAAEHLATQHENRIGVRRVHQLRGEWCLERGEWAQAAVSLRRALEMAHERRVPDDDTEIALALAKHHLDPHSVTRADADRLARLRAPRHRYLARLWLALGDFAQAKYHALKAYDWAWADGEPYVNRYELTKTSELLTELKVPIPNLPRYDSKKDEPFSWEADVRAAIEKLVVEKKQKERTKRRKRN